LLPLYPLDGGRFLEHVLLCRNPRLELLFKFIAGLALGWLASTLQSILLGILDLFVILSLRETYAASEIAQQLQHGFCGGSRT
jgi:Zn-dependent protease